MNAKLVMVLRYIVGVILVVFGLNGFFSFIPMGQMADAAMQFFGAIMNSGYLFQVVKALEIVIGVMLLANRYVPLALLVLVPLSINFVLFHLFLDVAGIAVGAVVFVLNVVLLFAYKRAYDPLLKPVFK